MSRSWKRLAAFAENTNFDSADTCAAATHALDCTWRSEVPDVASKVIREVFLEVEPCLFIDSRIERISAALSATAGYGLARLFADHACSVLMEGLTGESGLSEAARRALDACAARAARQVEEHYCRRGTAQLTRQVRERIGQAIASADFDVLSRRCAGLEPRGRRGVLRKHRDIDDGVPLS